MGGSLPLLVRINLGVMVMKMYPTCLYMLSIHTAGMYIEYEKYQMFLVGWLGFMTFNLCRLFNAKSIFMQIISSISNNSVKHECTV